MAKTKAPQQNRLTPTPKALQKALEQSAKQAQRVSDAFGVVVPSIKPKIASRSGPRVETRYPMNSPVETINAQVFQLSPVERIEVVERILASLDETDASLDALWAKEADDRLIAYRRGEVQLRHCLK